MVIHTMSDRVVGEGGLGIDANGMNHDGMDNGGTCPDDDGMGDLGIGADSFAHNGMNCSDGCVSDGGKGGMDIDTATRAAWMTAACAFRLLA